jgi:putative transposase
VQLLTGYRYRLEPTPSQAAALGQHGGACRWLWNHVLAYREDAYLAARAGGGKVAPGTFSYAALCRYLTLLRRDIPWLAAVSVEPLQQTLRDLDWAFAKFFKGQCNFPAFKRRAAGDGFRYPNPTHFAVEQDWVKLPKLGWVRFRQSRDLPGTVRNLTVSREGNHWFVAICVAHAIEDPVPPRGAPIALDLGIAVSAAASTGERIDLLAPTAKERRRLRFLARRVSRKVKGSHRRRLAIDRLAKAKRHLAACRRDAAHKLTTRLARSHSAVIIEDLHVRSMTASAAGTPAEPGRNVRAKSGLNRSLAGQAFGETRRLLAYKCGRSGAQLIAVPAAYSSQTCSQCQHCAPENRQSQADFRCVRCGFQLNADHNAALNILAAGSVVLARGGSDISPADEPRTLRRRAA